MFIMFVNFLQGLRDGTVRSCAMLNLQQQKAQRSSALSTVLSLFAHSLSSSLNLFLTFVVKKSLF